MEAFFMGRVIGMLSRNFSSILNSVLCTFYPYYPLNVSMPLMSIG